MRIQEIHIYQHDLSVADGAYTMSGASLTKLDTTIVEIVTNTGVTGFGETCPVGPTYAPAHARGARAALQEMAPILLGADPLKIERVAARMHRALNGHAYAKAAVDIALWDIAGKSYATRVCDLLGGAAQERVPSYYAISVAPPRETVKIALEMEKMGYPRLQLKIGGRPVEEDIAAIRMVREALKLQTRIAADGNRALTTRDTILLSQACCDLPLVLEQPCNTIGEMTAIRGQLKHPLYFDESADDIGVVSNAAAKGLCDGFGFKLTRLGGLSPMRTVRDICRHYSLPHTCCDAWGGDIIAAACVHMNATIEHRLNEGVWISEPLMAGHYDEVDGPRVKKGHIKVPRGPGLGVNPDKSVWGDPVLSFG